MLESVQSNGESNMLVRGFVAVAIILTSCVSGQSQTSVPAFDAASVKIADRAMVPGVTWSMKGGPETGDPGHIRYTQVTLIALLAKAWGVQQYRIVGPAWISDPWGNWYTFDAVLSPQTTRQQFQQMLQNLLIERFKIRLHHETRVFPGYELVIAPGGPKLKASAEPDAPDSDKGISGKLDTNGFLVLPPGRGSGVNTVRGAFHAKFQNYSITDLIAGPWLSTFIQQSTGQEGPTHIVDKTGLAGKYDITLQFDGRGLVAAVPAGAGAPDALEAVSAGLASEPSGLPNFFTALERQLGLKLVKVKGFPLDTLVIDQVERVPIEN
jgi:uncharacterized protein (TIGR03435 family)